MGVILPALSLAIVHIAGDNVAVVPAMAALLGNGIYATVFLAYMIFGSIVAGMSAWIGVKSGRELTTVVKRLFGLRGKRVLALAVLAVSLPASALTGGYFAGHLLEGLTGLPYIAAVPLCIVSCSLLAVGYGRELLQISNYLALLFIPATGIMLVMLLDTIQIVPFQHMISLEHISWTLVLALIGYNACGMRSALVVETGAYFAPQNYTGVYLAVLAKFFEGFFTLLLAHLALVSGTSALMPLPAVADKVFGPWLAIGFNSILLCIFINTMVPAMLVNAKQLSVLTKLNLWPALAVSGLLIWFGSFISLDLMLLFMSGTGVVMIAFICYIAYSLHKQGANKLQ
ncbi:hypothetical protein [Sporomusa sp.]|uniref:hypothetical protein n=1 Tax=Sporomusa sp. TaxID=2078658 RepID=UPI002CB13794|nr:hypothetical protein [Sporomusa sp.]HWR09416.1 hypothetical protein [Sporomusa sp.]